MVYAFSERFVMPFSHDEVVHGKGSLISRMPGDYRMKFAGVRAIMAYMMTHPGKKLTFMGCEIGQFDEWNSGGEVQWFLLDHHYHSALQLYFARLNHFYLEHSELWEEDSSWEGFQWVDVDRRDESIFSYRRISKDGSMTVVLNLTPVERQGFELALEEGGEYEEIFNSDSEEFGGEGRVNRGIITAEEWEGDVFTVRLTLPPMSAIIVKKKEQNK